MTDPSNRPPTRPAVESIFTSLGIPHDVVVALKLATLGRLILASILGGLIGLERELAGKPAGLRTNLLICAGAALFTDLSLQLASLGTEGGFRSDPARLAAQIIPGIGFIGAGSILHARGKVTGITTAATLWVVTAIGISVGAGAYVEAIGTALLVLFTLALLAKFERILDRRLAHRRYSVAVDAETEAFDRLQEAFRRAGLRVKVEAMEKSGADAEITFRLTGPLSEHEALIRHMVGDRGVRRFTRH